MAHESQIPTEPGYYLFVWTHFEDPRALSFRLTRGGVWHMYRPETTSYLNPTTFFQEILNGAHYLDNLEIIKLNSQQNG